MIRIIDNKKIDLTADEFEMYENICKAYHTGKDLFKNLFETDDNGIIVYLKPPQKIFSMEVVVFLQNIMVHQHLRRIYDENNSSIAQLRSEINDLKSQIDVLKSKE